MTYLNSFSQSQNKASSTSSSTTTSSGPASLTSMLSGSSTSNGAPQSLEQLLERQWEQGSQFLMEQAQHFDSKSPFSSSSFNLIQFPSSCISLVMSTSIEN